MRLDVRFTHDRQACSVQVEVRETTLATCPVALVVGGRNAYRNVGGRTCLAVDLPYRNRQQFASKDGADCLAKVAAATSFMTGFDFHDPFGRFGEGWIARTLEDKERRVRDLASRLVLLDGTLHVVAAVPRLRICLDYRARVELTDGTTAEGDFNLDQIDVVRSILADLDPGATPMLPAFDLRDRSILPARTDTSRIEGIAKRKVQDARVDAVLDLAKDVVKKAFRGRTQILPQATSASLAVSAAIRRRNLDDLGPTLVGLLPHVDGEARRDAEAAIHAASAAQPVDEADMVALLVM